MPTAKMLLISKFSSCWDHRPNCSELPFFDSNKSSLSTSDFSLFEYNVRMDVKPVLVSWGLSEVHFYSSSSLIAFWLFRLAKAPTWWQLFRSSHHFIFNRSTLMYHRKVWLNRSSRRENAKISEECKYERTKFIGCQHRSKSYTS